MPAGYDRLTSEDTQFLFYETPNAPMHVAALMLFERGPLATEGGGVDIERFRKGVAAQLHRVPRFRQRLAWIPLANQPVWVDEPAFDLRYHVRHTSLPKPGSQAQLRELVGRIMSQRLDRSKPLWEYWVIEGLEGDRFALLTKIHHCMMDGSSGSDLLHVLMSPEPDWQPVAASPYTPRPAPSGAELLRDHVWRRLRQPREALAELAEFARATDDLPGELGVRLRAVRDALGLATQPGASSPISGELSPHRRSDWMAQSLEDLKRVRRAAGTTLNDVVLAVVAGAFRRYLAERGCDLATTSVRSAVPVNVRAEGERTLGNRVSNWALELPIAEPDPRARLQQIAAVTQELKATQNALGVQLMMRFIEFAPSAVLSLAARAAKGVCDTLVTNVPGPQIPLYMFGARMLALCPQAPLLPGMGLGVGLMSYDGQLCWGLTGDAELAPDVDRFAGMLREAFAELAECYGVALDSEAAAQGLA